jgi:hypothetical protein
MAYARLVRDDGGAAAGFDRSLDECADRTKASRKTMQRAQARLLELKLIEVTHRPVKGAKHLTNVVRIVSKEWLAWIAKGPKPSANIGGHQCPTSENRFNRKDGQPSEKIAEGPSDEAIAFAGELANIAGYRREAVPQAWRDADPPALVQSWLDKGRPFGVGLTYLRSMCALVMRRRRETTDDRPYSPRYFTPELDRFLEMLARPLPPPPKAAPCPLPARHRATAAHDFATPPIPRRGPPHWKGRASNGSG